MTLGQQCNLRGLCLPREVAVTPTPSQCCREDDKRSCLNVLGTTLPHKLPQPSPLPIHSALGFPRGLPGTKLELHVTCLNLTQDML